MPNIKSAEKRVKVAEKKALNNSIIKSQYKTAAKKVTTAVENGEKDVEKLLNDAKKLIDRAGSKGVISKNAAARRKSILEKKVSSKQPAKKATKKVESKAEEPAKKTTTKKAETKTATKTATKTTTKKTTTTKKAAKKEEK